MHHPGVGSTQLEFDAVTGLQLPSTAPLDFTHFSLPTSGEDVYRLSMLASIAQKVYEFSKATFVDGRGQFDCRAFLGYVMGWDAEITTGVRRNYYGKFVGPEETHNSLPYLLAQKGEDVTPHAVLGIDQGGKSLSVVGLEYPLIIADNASLLRAFGCYALLEVSEIENL